jgi:hypothetical protein
MTGGISGSPYEGVFGDRRSMPRPRKWSGVEAKLLAQVAGVEDPAQAICLLVDELLTEAEQDQPPIELGVVASFQGIRRISRAAIKDAAMISLTAEARAEMERRAEEIRRREASKPRQLSLGLEV